MRLGCGWQAPDDMMQPKNYILLTGATGLLGRFLMRDLLSKGLPLAVLARSRNQQTATERINEVLAKGLPVPFPADLRPVVIEGSIAGDEGTLVIAEADRKWIAEHVTSVVNSAASLEFEHSLRTNEPFRTNVEGTRALVNFSQSMNIQEFHHVSTAYICGDRKGKIFESELDCGQISRNAYEQSKLTAELLVSKSKVNFKTVTIYRPSIIVGDHVWGFTNTFHGFYLPLKILRTILQYATTPIDAVGFWSSLGMTATDSKNLVPVDWVSAAITRIVSSPMHHGQTFHLTNWQPTSVELIGEVFTETLTDLQRKNSTYDEALDLFSAFAEQMAPYRAYWSHDPEFDQHNLLAALPDLPSPTLSRRTLLRLSRFAINQGFTVKT